MGADGISSSGSATGTGLEAADESPETPAGAFAASSAQRLNADMEKKANAAVAIILALNLIVASRTADPDRPKSAASDESGANTTCQKPRHLHHVETAMEGGLRM
jgi:hypothetical protein